MFGIRHNGIILGLELNLLNARIIFFESKMFRTKEKIRLALYRAAHLPHLVQESMYRVHQPYRATCSEWPQGWSPIQSQAQSLHHNKTRQKGFPNILPSEVIIASLRLFVFVSAKATKCSSRAKWSPPGGEATMLSCQLPPLRAEGSKSKGQLMGQN